MGLTAASALVACVAVHAVVHISVHVGMMEIGSIVAAVAAGALEHSVVTGSDVARGADAVCSAVVHVEPGVIEGGPQPRRSGVARGACGRETGRNMIGIVGSLVIDLVARVAVGRRAGIHVVDMARRACHVHVRAGQWEGRLGVIEDRS